LLIERGAVSVARLDTIRRQQDAPLRTAVVAASESAGTSRAVTLLEQQGRVVEIDDRRERHARIAADFGADGGRGIVIAPSNAERADLNRRIREGLIEAGQVERHSFKAQVVVKRDLTAEQRTRASNYAPGDVLRFVRRGRGIEAGERIRVTTVDEEHNRLVVASQHEVFEINPKQHRNFEVERVEERRFAVGDRVQFRERDRALDVANGTLATIRHLDLETGQAVLEVGRRRVSLDLSELRALDYAYAVTSHRSQGLSRARVYLTVDTRHSDELVNRRQFYVSVSRGVQDARVYADDRARLARTVSREQTHENALSIAGETVPLAVEPPDSQTPASMIALPKSALEVAERNPPLASGFHRTGCYAGSSAQHGMNRQSRAVAARPILSRPDRDWSIWAAGTGPVWRLRVGVAGRREGYG
jgi:hypothetical protein